MSWFAAYSRPQLETAAALEIQRCGLGTFLPMARVRKLRARGRDRVPVWTERPLFSRWLFVGASRETLHRVGSCRYIVGFATMDGEPLEIPAPIIEELKRRTNAAGIAAEKDELQREIFADGDAVRFISETPLAGRRAIVVEDKGGQRIEVVLPFLGVKRPTRVPANWLERA